MRLVLVSDTHGQLGKVNLPPGDILVHAGDLTMQGTLVETTTVLNQLRDLRAVYRHIVFVAGNHDWMLYAMRGLARAGIGLVYLDDDVARVGGLKFYGSAWTPRFGRWAFMEERGSDRMRARWDAIPEGLDVLVTHGPPHGILDEAYEGEHAGCELLAERIATMEEPPRYHVFGHIHESYGREVRGPTTFLNVATCDGAYRLANSPVIVDINLI